jgi:hypothetical protein
MRHDQLMPDECILQYSDNNLVTLTSHRVRYNNSEWGSSNFISIMLEKISSVQVLYISHPALWILGCVVAIIGVIIASGNNEQHGYGIIPCIVGVFLIAAYFSSKKHICIISSDGGSKIMFKTDGMSTATLIALVDKIEEAKCVRLTEISKKTL